MSFAGSCKNREHKKHWVVVQYRHNRSAFNGYQFTPSEYSLIRCDACGSVWRTKAAYVEELIYARKER